MITRRSAIRVLIVSLAFLGLWYAGWVVGNRAVHHREVILDPSSKVAYCMAIKMTSNEKRIVAESLQRPSDPILIGRLMPIILSGTPSEEKRAVGRAIEERNVLYSRTKQIIFRVADICRVNELEPANRPDFLLELVVAWLRYDEAFNTMLGEGRTPMRDALTRLDLAYARNNPHAALK